MSNSAYIRDIASLEQLRIAIVRFCEESENQLHTIDSKLQSRIGNLKSLELHFQRTIESTQEDLQSAYNSLSSCKSNTDKDEDGNTIYPNCDSEQEDVTDCNKRLELAKYNYNSFKRKIKNLEISIAEYQKPKVKYKTLIQFEKEAATSSLKQLIRGAEDYLSIFSPLNNGLVTGVGLTEAVAKITPTMISAAIIGVEEIIMMRMFSFLGSGGGLFSVSNKNKKGLITTTFSGNGFEHTCSELKIEKNNTGNFGKIVSVNIPPSLQSEKMGRHLIINMEAICRANDCKEVSGWANTANVGFYQGLNYQIRNEIKETGAEIYKPLESNFLSSQQKARAQFEQSNKFNKLGEFNSDNVNPLMVIAPDDFNSEIFWRQHIPDGSPSKYVELIKNHKKSKSLMMEGKSIDEVFNIDNKAHNAYQIFKSQPIKLIKKGDYYEVEQGRHRVMAVQYHYLTTGEIFPLTAQIIEYQV